MGIWSKPIFTNCPEAKVCWGWFAKGNPEHTILWHLTDFSQEDIDNNVEISLEKFVELIYENSKIWGHMNRDVISGWLHFMTKLKEKNPLSGDIEIHLYCIDEGHPYYFKVEEKEEKVRVRVHIMPAGHVYYNKITMNEDDGEYVEFDEEMYKKNYMKVFATSFINLKNELENRRGFMF